jgi:hypothetical protein
MTLWFNRNWISASLYTIHTSDSIPPRRWVQGRQHLRRGGSGGAQAAMCGQTTAEVTEMMKWSGVGGQGPSRVNSWAPPPPPQARSDERIGVMRGHRDDEVGRRSRLLQARDGVWIGGRWVGGRWGRRSDCVEMAKGHSAVKWLRGWVRAGMRAQIGFD